MRLFLINNGIFIQWNTIQLNEVGLLVVNEIQEAEQCVVLCFFFYKENKGLLIHVYTENMSEMIKTYQ